MGKKLIVILGVIALAATIGLPTSHAWPISRNKVSVIQGLKDGSLNPNEYSKVKTFHNATVKMRRDYRSDGYLSPKEKSVLKTRYKIETDSIKTFRQGPNKSGNPWLK